MGCCGSVEGWEEQIVDVPQNFELYGGNDEDYTNKQKTFRVNTGYSPADGWTFAIHDVESIYLTTASSSKVKNKMNIKTMKNSDVLYTTTYSKGGWQIHREDTLIANIKRSGMTEYHYRVCDVKGKVLFSVTSGMCGKDSVAVYRTPQGKVFAKVDQTRVSVGSGVNVPFLLAFICTSILPNPMS